MQIPLRTRMQPNYRWLQTTTFSSNCHLSEALIISTNGSIPEKLNGRISLKAFATNLTQIIIRLHFSCNSKHSTSIASSYPPSWSAATKDVIG